jgi:hypothetical protein
LTLVQPVPLEAQDSHVPIQSESGMVHPF